MINFILLVNKLGQTRIAQYYVDLPLEEWWVLEAELVRKCLSRNESKSTIFSHQKYKIVYRRYVSLYFIIGIDSDEEVNSIEWLYLLFVYSFTSWDFKYIFRKSLWIRYHNESRKDTFYFGRNDLKWANPGSVSVENFISASTTWQNTTLTNFFEFLSFLNETYFVVLFL